MPASATGLPQRMADLPLVVLSAGGSDTTPEARARLADWVAAHKRLAARSTRGTQITVPGASHLIQRDAPDAVVSAVEAVRALAAHP